MTQEYVFVQLPLEFLHMLNHTVDIYFINIYWETTEEIQALF